MKMNTHRHEYECWERGSYEPCGEHHAHDANCGGGRLSPKCPEYEDDAICRARFAVVTAIPYLRNAKFWAKKLGKDHPRFKKITQALELLEDI